MSRRLAFPTLSVVAANPLQSLLAEPAVENPPVRVWRDWAVAAAIVTGSAIEAVFRTDVPWKIPTLVVSAIVAMSVLRRRTQPLTMLIAAFASVQLLSIVVRVVDGGVAGFYSMAFLLVNAYAVFRWGSGRQVVASIPILLAAWLVGITTDPGTLGEAIGGLVVLTIAPIVGFQVRQFKQSRVRALDQARLAERELLARELHDTVAHHVSAIAIQAQAGRAIAGTQPQAAVDVLAVIEEAASRTLAEMRAMVGALRHDGDDADLTPQRGVADIGRLAGSLAIGPALDVRLSGDLGDLRPSIDTALYRIAQESITNASRHAVGATRIDVSVIGEPDCVRLTVTDDGRGTASGVESAVGFGLVGMAERVKLLGGSITAGRAGEAGWVVDAVLPRERSAS